MRQRLFKLPAMASVLFSFPSSRRLILRSSTSAPSAWRYDRRTTKPKRGWDETRRDRPRPQARPGVACRRCSPPPDAVWEETFCAGSERARRMFGRETEGSLTPEGKSVNKRSKPGPAICLHFSVQRKQIWRCGLNVFPG